MKAAEPIVFVVDDDTALLRSLQRTLLSAGWPVQTYTSGHDFLETYDPTQSGCVVLDIRMPYLSGLSVQEALIHRNARIPIIFMTAYGEVTTVVQAMKAGAMDFLEKPFTSQALLTCVEAAVRHDTQMRREQLHRDTIKARLAFLTPREREVLDLVVDGYINKEIASRLGIQPRTVEIHRQQVMKKLGTHSSIDLVRLVLGIRT
jgi:two-component system, LuxR family, response regulator FixJ